MSSKCSICAAEGTNCSTCPFNLQYGKPNPRANALKHNTSEQTRQARQLRQTGEEERIVEQMQDLYKKRHQQLSEREIADGETIYNPHYQRLVAVDGYDNCAATRETTAKNFRTYSLRSKYCDILPLERIQKIVGPYRYYHYTLSMPVKVNISLFGEWHIFDADELTFGTKTNSVLFSSYLEALALQNPDVQYDFFMEVAHVDRETPERNSNDNNGILNVLRADFDKCLQVVKDCPYKNLRAHYVDFRDRHNDPKLEEYYHILPRWIYNEEEIPQHILSNTLADYFGPAYVKGHFSSIKTWINRNSRLQKELNSSYLKEPILKYINDALNESYAKYQVAAADIPDYEWPKRLRDVGTEHSEAIKIMLNHVIESYTVIMDIYMLARMFKIFKDGTSPENIIVYAGAQHVINIDRFIQEYLPKEDVIIHRLTVNDKNYVDIYTE